MDSFWKSYAGKEHEDLLVDMLLAFKEKGTYVEIGANDPSAAVSVTTRFYKRGWHGINVEPCLGDFKKLEEARKGDINLNICIGEKSGTMPFYELENSVGSSLLLDQAKKARNGMKMQVREIQVLSLQDLFTKHPLSEIDFMLVDVEGYELEVLRGNDWAKYRPKVMIIETIHKNYTEIVAYLEEKGYLLVYNNHLNSIFINKEVFKNDTRFDMRADRPLARQK